jgi:hypothetical protein
MTARQSRIGLSVLPSEKLAVGGRVEWDFYGGGPENKNLPMLRQAYLEWDRPGKDLSFLAGQTADVISPLVAPTVNYTVSWWAGNIGYRNPQVRVTWGTGRASSGRTSLQGALSRPAGDVEGSGEDSARPVLQGRLAQSFRVGKAKPSTLGVWGHDGMEDYDYLSDASTPTWSVRAHRTSSSGGDLELNLPVRATLKGEGWWGRNLDAYLGGIGQGVNASRHLPIRARGGWASLTLGPFGRTTLDGGWGFDKPCEEDLQPGDRARNRMVWVNAFFRLDAASQFAVEASQWKTETVGKAPFEALRGQVAWILHY